jgi:hypothetical protein
LARVLTDLKWKEAAIEFHNYLCENVYDRESCFLCEIFIFAAKKLEDKMIANEIFFSIEIPQQSGWRLIFREAPSTGASATEGRRCGCST